MITVSVEIECDFCGKYGGEITSPYDVGETVDLSLPEEWYRIEEKRFGIIYPRILCKDCFNNFK